MTSCPCPAGRELFDLATGISLDPRELHASIAGHEAGSGRLSIHFFDRGGHGVLKVVLVPGPTSTASPSSCATTRRTRRRHASARARAAPGLQRAAPSWPRAADLPGRVDRVRAGARRRPSPRRPRRLLLDALRLAGRDRALFLTKVGLAKAVLAAHRASLPLHVTGWEGGLRHEATVMPRRIERCGRALPSLRRGHRGAFVPGAGTRMLGRLSRRCRRGGGASLRRAGPPARPCSRSPGRMPIRGTRCFFGQIASGG
ncbi:MAG: hypothetical protein WDO13_15920 [Verrucomicrobiota bacterium]